MEDLRNLNVPDPDELTRVTEYGPEIVDYVARIADNGFAFDTPDGSVYFDIKAFEQAGSHYAKLEPWNRNDKASPKRLGRFPHQIYKDEALEKRLCALQVFPAR